MSRRKIAATLEERYNTRIIRFYIDGKTFAFSTSVEDLHDLLHTEGTMVGRFEFPADN